MIVLSRKSAISGFVLTAIKKRAGKDFIIELLISGEDRPGGNTTEDYCEILKMADGLADIVQVRSYEVDPNHPTGFMSDPNPTLRYSKRFKQLGLKMKIAPVGGFQDPDAAEAAIRDGKADMISAARAFICEPDYIAKIREGRKEDIAPCIRCNKCHAISRKGLIRTACSVNPEYGLEHDLHNLVTAPSRSKKVAVIGGGPGGMEAAIRASRRGHSVTLYEKAQALGGALIAASVPDFKWPVQLYLDYLRYQTAKAAIDVRLNTAASPEKLSAGDYDAVIVALGADAAVPPIPGISAAVGAAESLLCPEKVGNRVIVIGGGEVGLETAMYFAQKGRSVTILEMKDELAEDSPPQHYRTFMLKCAGETEGLDWILNATVLSVENGTVKFSENGEEKALPADTVIVSAGTVGKPRAALEFAGCAPEFFVIGDCREAGNILNAVRGAFAATANL